MFGWTLALLSFYFFLTEKGVLDLQCRVRLPSNKTVPMFEDAIQKLSQQLASQWHCLLFSYFFKIKFVHQGSTHIPLSLVVSFSTQAQHPHTSPPPNKISALESSNWNAGHGFGQPTLRPPQPKFLHLPLWHGPPGALTKSAAACLQPLSMCVTVYSGLAIKVTPPFSLLIYCHHGCIHFLQHSCLYSWILKGEKKYIFKTVIWILFFINQYQASKQVSNWYEYKLIHACYIKLEN